MSCGQTVEKLVPTRDLRIGRNRRESGPGPVHKSVHKPGRSPSQSHPVGGRNGKFSAEIADLPLWTGNRAMFRSILFGFVRFCSDWVVFCAEVLGWFGDVWTIETDWAVVMANSLGSCLGININHCMRTGILFPWSIGAPSRVELLVDRREPFNPCGAAPPARRPLRKSSSPSSGGEGICELYKGDYMTALPICKSQDFLVPGDRRSSPAPRETSPGKNGSAFGNRVSKYPSARLGSHTSLKYLLNSGRRSMG